MKPRIKEIYAGLDDLRLDAFLASIPANITYLTQYPSRDSYLLASKKASVYFTDSRYAEEAKSQLPGGISVQTANGSVFKMIGRAILSLGLKRVGFEERSLPYAEYAAINSCLKSSVRFIPTHGLVEALRATKDTAEIQKIKRSAEITVKAMRHVKGLLRPGIKEIEIVAELEHFIRYHGGSDSAFEIIVASGPNTAFAHHIPGQRKLKNNEPVMIDVGVEFQGYKSDLTRVFFLGKISTLGRRIYNIVLAAQQQALAKIAPGVKASEVDAAGRSLIEKQGFGLSFGHSLGHGIGLEVHEDPHISGSSDTRLEPGMIFTVEPAIYLAGKFGIRLEDMVLVTKKGCVLLSGTLNK